MSVEETVGTAYANLQYVRLDYDSNDNKFFTVLYKDKSPLQNGGVITLEGELDYLIQHYEPLVNDLSQAIDNGMILKLGKSLRIPLDLRKMLAENIVKYLSKDTINAAKTEQYLIFHKLIADMERNGCVKTSSDMVEYFRQMTKMEFNNDLFGEFMYENQKKVTDKDGLVEGELTDP